MRQHLINADEIGTGTQKQDYTEILSQSLLN